MVQKYLNKNKLNYEEDKFLVLCICRHFKMDILFLYLKNIVLEYSIRIINYLSEDGLSSISRNIIVLLKDFSKATLVQELYSPEKKVNNSQSQQQAYFESRRSSCNVQCSV